jgi:hypothetical protein
MDQDDARVGRIASFDVVHVDARRDFGRIVLEAHDDEMSYERYWLYATQCRDLERLLRSEIQVAIRTYPYLQRWWRCKRHQALGEPQRDSRVARRDGATENNSL